MSCDKNCACNCEPKEHPTNAWDSAKEWAEAAVIITLILCVTHCTMVVFSK